MKGETQMKKVLATIMMIFCLVLVSTACTNSSNTPDNPPSTTTGTTNIKWDTDTKTEPPTPPELSTEFVNTALQYIDKYPAETQELLNLSAEVIRQSSDFKDNLFQYLNETTLESHKQSIGYYSKIETVNVAIHNYEMGGDVGCVSFNGQEYVYNYNHDPLLLAAGVLSSKYPDNVTLAEARIASYVLLNMDENDVDCCIKKSSEGEYYYDFTLQNEDFANTSREILKGLCEE